MSKKLRILVADDQPVNLRVAARLLRELGHGGVLVGDGAQAVSAMSQQHFDLVMLDVTMPVLDGLEALRHIRQNDAARGSRLPVVMVTGHDSPESAEMFVRDGADAVIVKPLELDKLRASLRRLGLS